MRIVTMKRGQALLALLLAALIGGTLVVGADAAMNARKRAYFKNVRPPGWKYEMGYTIWRTSRGLAATPQTWNKYVREKKRLAQRGKLRGLDQKLLNGVDWTVEEVATFLEAQQEAMRDPY